MLDEAEYPSLADAMTLFSSYARSVDKRDAPGVAALFADYGFLSVGGKRHLGHQAISDFVAALPTTVTSRHETSKICLLTLAEKRAVFGSRFTVMYRGAKGWELNGRGAYRDTLEVADGDVRFVSREITLDVRQ